MSRLLTLFLVFVLATFLVNASEEVEAAVESVPEATLLLQKTMTAESGYFGVGHNFTVTLSLFNVGDGSATDITVFENWPEDGFQLIEGEKHTHFDIIEAGAEEVFNLTFVCMQEGVFDGFRGHVQYVAIEGSQPKVGVSTGMRKMYILPGERWELVTKDRSIDQILVVGFFVLSIVGPLLSWFMIQKGNKNGDTSKKNQ